MKQNWSWTTLSCIAAVSITGIAGCAGGGQASSNTGDSGVSVAWGSPMSEFHDALADMDPVTLKFQATPAGPPPYGSPEAYKQRIEEWSGGKIEIEIIYAQAVSPWGETTEAVADRRLDLGVELPTYVPGKYPATNELTSLSVSTAGSPYFDEMIAQAAMLDVGWNTPEIQDEWSEKGVNLLIPAELGAAGSLICTEPNVTMDALESKQVRVASEADLQLVESLGATPVSMAATELYEALQRNVIDCGVGRQDHAIGYGLLEHAPHLIFPNEDAGFVRTPITWVAGPTFNELPLAAQQIVFDAGVQQFINNNDAFMQYLVDVFEMADEKGGGIHRLDAEAGQQLTATAETLLDEFEQSDALDGTAARERYNESFDKWEKAALDLGYENITDFAEFAETYRSEPIDIEPFANAMFEGIYLPHRPA